MTDWHTRIQRSQQLARAFAGLGNRCFFVNPHLGCEYPVPYLAAPNSRLSILEPHIYELHVHLPREHVFHSRLLETNESGRVSRAIEGLTATMNSRRAVQIVSFPIWLDASKALRAKRGFPIIYDCHDALTGFRGVAPEIAEAEACLFKDADLVVFSSEQLMASTIAAFPAVANRAALVRNGVDPDHFCHTSRNLGAKWRDRKVVGYVGSLDHWFDIETFSRAARAFPNWLFQLIGRVEDARFKALRELSNVELAGEVPYASLPRYMGRFDVAIIPFLRTTLTLATNPIKLYEYFSLGLPVVSTRLPEVELHGDAAYVADDAAQFIQHLKRAAAETDTSLRCLRLAIAQSETWNKRAVQMLDAIASQVGGISEFSPARKNDLNQQSRFRATQRS